MTEAYIQNIKVADLVLELNPISYTQQFMKLGSFKRTIGGGIVDVDINGKKLALRIEGLAQSQVEEIKKRTVLNKVIDFIDYVPIAEKGSQSRVVYEDLGSETINSEIVYLYIPTYKVLITDFIPVYANNVMAYTLNGEEA